MARQVLPIVGAVIGAYFGNPQLGYAIGAIIGNAVDPQVIKGPKIGDAGVQTSAEGVFRPVVYGTAAVMGNVIERGNRQIRVRREQQGKGGPVTEEERVFWTFAIRICEGPIQGVIRIWEDEKLVYDGRPQPGMDPAESANFAGRFRLYLGDETQLPDPDLESYKGIGNVNAYRGTAYIVFPNYDLTDRRESIPNYRFEVTTASEEFPIDKLGENPFPPEYFISSGLSPGTVGQFTSATIPALINDVPISLVEFFAYDNVGSVFTYPAPIRAQLFYASGTLAFDSGWLGDPAYQADLDSLISMSGYPFMGGPITDSPFIGFTPLGNPRTAAISLEIYPQPDKLGYFRIYTARPYTWAGTNVGGFIRARQVDANDLVPGAVAFPTIPGTLMEPDSTIVAAPWGPDVIQREGGATTLANIVSEMHERMGQDLFSVSELTDDVYGIVLAGDYTGADVIRTLMPVYAFDASEFDSGSGYRAHYPKRGKAVVTTLTIDSLIDIPDETERKDPLEYPWVLHMHFQNPKIGYAPAKASPTRFSVNIESIGELSTQVPVVFDDPDEAWQRADVMLKQAWTEVNGTEEFSIPINLLSLVPSDCVGVVLRNQVRRMRIVEQNIEGGTIALKMISDRQSAYTSTLTGIPLPTPTPPLPTIVGDSILWILDIPALTDNNDRLLYYVAFTGISDAWHGATVQRLNGTNWETVRSGSTPSIMGTLAIAVADASEHYTDTTNSVTVTLLREDESIESLTDQEFLSEMGSFALESPDGSWEILQYRDADQNSDGSWTLSHLLRGRLNTDTTNHTVGARFVLLDTVYSVDATTSMLGQTLVHRAVSFGQSPDGVGTRSDIYEGLSQTEFPVAHILGEIHGTDLEVQAIPRNRFGTEITPVRSINWSGYRFSVTDGSNTINRDSMDASQTFDITGWSTPVTVTVSQLNRFTGAGPSVSEAFP